MINNFVIIIGAMKSGTSSLFSYLSQHPSISPCKTKEPNFFSNDTNWNKGLDWYKRLWDWNPKIHKYALEASTHYTKIPSYPNAAKRISTVKANFKFIYIMRDPIKRIESHYSHNIRNKEVEELKTIISRVKSCHLIETSRYAKQIIEYYKRFPEDSILLLRFESLRAYPRKVLTKVCEFLRIDPDFSFKGIGNVYNKSGLVNKSPLWNFLEGITLLRKFAKKIIPFQLREAVRFALSKKSKFYYKLSKKEKEFVINELREDLRILKTRYGVDLDEWELKI
jgi:hypothetical protein